MRESVSSSPIASVTTEGEMPSMAAAALTFPLSATAMK